MHSGLQFLSRPSETLCTFHWVMYLTNTTYYRQTMAEQKAITKPSSHTCVITVPKINAIGIYLCSHRHTHKIHKYSAQQKRLDLAWSSTGNHLSPPHLSHQWHCRLTPGAKTQGKRSAATDYFPIYLKCGPTPPNEWNPLRTATCSSKTPKCEKDAISCRLAHLCGLPTVSNACYRQTGHGSILQITFMRPWALSLHIDHFSHRNHWTGRNTEQDIPGLPSLKVQLYGTSRRQCTRRTTNIIIKHPKQVPIRT